MKPSREQFIPRDYSAVIERPDLNAVVYLKDEPRITARGFSGKRARPDFIYAFKSSESRMQHIEKWFETLAGWVDMHEKRMMEKKEATKKFVRALEPGIILYDTWGYDQTQVEFYMVVKRIGAKVLLQELGCKTVPGSEGMMSDRVVPGNPIDNQPPIWKQIRGARVKINDSVILRIFPLEYMQYGVHRSWGH